MDVRQLFAAFSAKFKFGAKLCATVRTEAKAAIGCGGVSGGMSTPVTEPLVQGVRFFSVLYDVEGGIAVFPRGVFEIVHRLDDAYDDEQHAEQREKGRRAHDAAEYGVFVINEDDYMWRNSDKSLIQQTANNLQSYLDAKVTAKYAKPIFVVSHLPLHYSMRTKNDGDGKYAIALNDGC